MMTRLNRLWVRLTLAFLIVAWLAISATAVIVRSTTESSFRQYVQEREAASLQGVSADELQAYYADTGSWTGVEVLLPGPKSDGQGQGQGQGQGRIRDSSQRGAKVSIADSTGVVVASTDAARLGTQLDGSARQAAIALTVQGAQVGWLVQETPTTQILGEAETDFLDKMTDTFLITAVGVALLAVLVGVGLSWQIARPLRTLTHAVEDLQAGDLGRQVLVSGSAEVTELSGAFNAMSRDLAAGEKLRQRMAADIAHELRTPVSVLRGHLEAMLDGVFPLDARHLAVAYDQTIHLARLVEDLRLLTRAEAGQLPLKRVPAAPEALVAQAVERFKPLAADVSVTLTSQVAPGLPPVDVDVDRLQQIFGNLLANALRHTPQSGRITVGATRQPDGVLFSVCNTGSPLSADQRLNVFKPFWRAEEARERDSGGTGLGLAIAQQLVALHGGHIRVESEPQQTCFTFTIPTAS
ncbi:MAG: HAMP domain-containing histidine kinase [Anaerolineae bacterium]|nr:HAMP domain-containing histidine kinase [Anaerolineae bacterium]